MRNRPFQLARLSLLVLVAGTLAIPAPAQRGAHQGRKKQGAKAGQPERGPGLPTGWIERLRQMSPEEQERFLSNNKHFQSLPPERQALIRERLRQWNRLTPEQQRAIRAREQVWRQLSPEQRERVRQEILPKWQQLEPARRLELRRRLGELADLSEQERAAKLSSESFLQGLSPQETELLRQLSRLRLGSLAGGREP